VHDPVVALQAPFAAAVPQYEVLAELTHPPTLEEAI